MPYSSQTTELYQFFLGLTRQTLQTLHIGGPTAAEYVAEVCARFARADALYAVQDASGKQLTDLVSISYATGMAEDAAEETLARYVGEFALFMSGLFHRYVAERGVLDFYYRTGAAAYRQAAGTEPALAWPPASLLR